MWKARRKLSDMEFFDMKNVAFGIFFPRINEVLQVTEKTVLFNRGKFMLVAVKFISEKKKTFRWRK